MQGSKSKKYIQRRFTTIKNGDRPGRVWEPTQVWLHFENEQENLNWKVFESLERSGEGKGETLTVEGEKERRGCKPFNGGEYLPVGV